MGKIIRKLPAAIFLGLLAWVLGTLIPLGVAFYKDAAWTTLGLPDEVSFWGLQVFGLICGFLVFLLAFGVSGGRLFLIFLLSVAGISGGTWVALSQIQVESLQWSQNHHRGFLAGSKAFLQTLPGKSEMEIFKHLGPPQDSHNGGWWYTFQVFFKDKRYLFLEFQGGVVVAVKTGKP